MGTRLLITGGAGFIGSHIARDFLDFPDYDVYVIDDLSGGDLRNLDPKTLDLKISIPDGIHYTVLDLRDEEATRRVVEFINPDILVHCAANAREGASFFQPISIVGRNTVAFANTLIPCIKNRIEKVVLFSSMAVYGDQTPPFTEDMPLKPVDIYGLQKANMEQMLQQLAEVYSFGYTIVRPHNVFGPNQSLQDPFRNVFGIWMNKIMRNEPIYIFGEGEQTRAFSYIGNSVPVYREIIMEEEPAFEIVNVGGDTIVDIMRAASLVKIAMGVPISYPTEYVPKRHGEVQDAFCDHSRMQHFVDVTERHLFLEEGLQRMADWARSVGPQEWRKGDPIEIDNTYLYPKVWK